MIRIARLNEKNIVVEIMEFEDPRAALHPDVLKMCVSATKDANVGDMYQDQKFFTPDPEELEDPDLKKEIEIARIKLEAVEFLRKFDIEEVKTKTTKDVIAKMIQAITGEVKL